ncbi:MAG: hypothetical protein IRZ23_05475 [Acetobacteraceae bacterium]|nr:hypothetical protein [Acetobacteraceae bacterium]
MRRGLIVRRMIWAASLIVLGNCSDSLAQRRAMLATHIGEKEIDLIRDFGVPTYTSQQNGRRYLTYAQAYRVNDPGYVDFLTGIVIPPSSSVYTCTTTFVIDHGTVSSFSVHGNGC